MLRSLRGTARGFSSAVPRRNAKAPEAVEVTSKEHFASVRWADGTSTAYHWHWLRDHCPACFHPSTHQRQVDTLAIPLDIKPAGMLFDEDDQELELRWKTGPRRDGTGVHVSRLSMPFLRRSAYAMPEDMERDEAGPDGADAGGAQLPGGDVARNFTVPRDIRLWARDSAHALPEFAAADVDSDVGFHDAMTALWRDGMLLVRGMEPTTEATRAFAERIGIVRRTFYGEMWDTKPPATAEEAESIVDTAYTNLELKPHTDGTYWRDPPGLQIFNCAEQSSKGGATWLVDGLQVAKTLAVRAPEAFKFFATCSLRWHHTDDEGVEVSAVAPVFSTRPMHTHGPVPSAFEQPFLVEQIRLNNDDRATVRMPAAQMEEFYRHLHTLLALTRSPELAHEVHLEQGTMLIVNNQRVMHGRRAFLGGSRNLLGCYMDRDDFESCLRRIGVLPSQRDMLPLAAPTPE